MQPVENLRSGHNCVCRKREAGKGYAEKGGTGQRNAVEEIG